MEKQTEIRVPDIGDFKDIEIIDVLVKKGDQVKIEDPLISLESDKATIDIPSTTAGTIKEIKVKTGDRVSEGDLILILEAADVEKDPGGKATPEKSGSEKPAAANSKDKPKPAPAKQASTAPAITQQEIMVPDIGDFKEVEVIEILVKPGDEVEVEAPLISIESDKATMEIPSPYAGTIKQILIKNGDKVSKGKLIAIIDAKSGTSVAAPANTAEPAAKPAESARTEQRPTAPVVMANTSMPASGSSATAHASPSIRKFARELGVDLGRVRGSGRKGRIVREDVTAFTRSVMSGQAGPQNMGALSLFEIPAVDFTKFGAVETIALTRLNKLTIKNVHRSWVNIPHVTQFDETDITDLEQYRASKKSEAEQHGTKLTILSFLIKAVVVVLKKYPRFNSSLAPDGENLILKKYFNIGFAVNTEQGLVVPVIKDADRKGIYDLAKELAALAQKARDKKIPPTDMQGGCFTISSLGHIGGTGFTPIVNAPEVAILGVSKASMRPVYTNSKFEPRLILPFSLSYDHRVIDGVAGAEFTKALAEILNDIRGLSL